MKKVTIPSSKYYISVDKEENQWWLRLRINSAIEGGIPLTYLEAKSVKRDLIEVLNMGHLELNDLQVELIQKEVLTFIEQEINLGKKTKKKQFGTIEDPRYNQVVNRLDQLSNAIENLDKKLSQVEKQV